MKKLVFASMLLAFAVGANAQETDFNYDLLQLGYANIDVDGAGDVGNGLTLGGSAGISDKVHVFGNYQTADLDFNVDLTRYNVGVGYNTAVSDTVDFIAGISYEYIEIDVGGFGSSDDNGFGLGAGLRFAASDQLEIGAGIKYVDYGDAGDDTTFAANVIYDLSETIALGLNGDFGDDISVYGLFGRFYF